MNSKYIFNVVGALVLCIVLLPSASMAQVFKCKDASGKIAYQSTPCAAAQQESRPVILDSPTLTDEEKFNAAAYSAGMTPKEAKRLLQGGAMQGQPAEIRQRQAPQRDYANTFECRQARRNVDIARSSIARSEGQKHSKVAALPALGRTAMRKWKQHAQKARNALGSAKTLHRRLHIHLISHPVPPEAAGITWEIVTTAPVPRYFVRMGKPVTE